MSITDQLLAALLLYGMPALFGVALIASVGAPLPAGLMLIAAGSFVEQGDMELWHVGIVAISAAVLGDQIGYGLARWGGRRLVARISRKIGGKATIKKTETFAKRWGGPSIFFSRWLVTPLGPWLNVTSGIAYYPWPRFILWDVLGQVLWVGLHVMLGYVFSDHIEDVGHVLGDIEWVLLGFIIAVILGWKIIRYLYSKKSVNA